MTSIGSADTYKDVLENPDRISKLVLQKGLDSGTAFEILSIDIADVDIGDNIGAKLQTEQADADKRVAQAKAEVRRAAAVAVEQEMRAKTQEMRAKVVEAESLVPQAMADAFRSGNLGIMDYVRMKNVQADTTMRESIGATEKPSTEACLDNEVADDIAAMNDTLIFLVLGALALIFKWLTSHASGDAEKPEPPSPNEQAPPPRPPAQSEEERIRRFLEALGAAARDAPSATGPPAPGGHTGDSACAETKSEAQLGATVAAPGYDAQRSRPSAANDHFFRAGRGRGRAIHDRCAATANHLAVRASADAPRDCALSCHAAPAVKHIAPPAVPVFARRLSCAKFSVRRAACKPSTISVASDPLERPAWRNWQTRWTQNPVLARVCGFDPSAGTSSACHEI